MRFYNPQKDGLYVDMERILQTPLPKAIKHEVRTIGRRHVRRLGTLIVVDTIIMIWMGVMAFISDNPFSLFLDCAGIIVFGLFGLREWEERDAYRALIQHG
jgi:hypothetical protein